MTFLSRSLLAMWLVAALTGCSGGLSTSSPQSAASVESLPGPSAPATNSVQTATLVVWTNYSLAWDEVRVAPVENPDVWAGAAVSESDYVSPKRYRSTVELAVGAHYRLWLEPINDFTPLGEAQVDLTGSTPIPAEVELLYKLPSELVE